MALNRVIIMGRMQKMGIIIYKLTGNDVLGLLDGQSAPAPAAAPAAAKEGQAKGESMGSAATDAAKSTMTSYGERLAERAKPDMNK